MRLEVWSDVKRENRQQYFPIEKMKSAALFSVVLVTAPEVKTRRSFDFFL